MAKLTAKQIDAMQRMAKSDAGIPGEVGEYAIDQRTGEALVRRGLFSAVGYPGDFWYPRRYRLTDAGRAVLAELDAAEAAEEQGDE